MIRFDQRDLAYTAGLFEGEGSIVCTAREGTRRWDGKRNKYYPVKRERHISLQIHMNDLEPLEKFADTFDIGKYTRGSLRGPYERTGARHKPYYTVKYSSFEEVQFVVATIWNWLSPRRKEQYRKAVKKYMSWGKDLDDTL